MGKPDWCPSWTGTDGGVFDSLPGGGKRPDYIGGGVSLILDLMVLSFGSRPGRNDTLEPFQ